MGGEPSGKISSCIIRIYSFLVEVFKSYYLFGYFLFFFPFFLLLIFTFYSKSNENVERKAITQPVIPGFNSTALILSLATFIRLVRAGL